MWVWFTLFRRGVGAIIGFDQRHPLGGVVLRYPAVCRHVFADRIDVFPLRQCANSLVCHFGGRSAQVPWVLGYILVDTMSNSGWPTRSEAAS